MATYRRHFPTRREIYLLLAVCIFPTHVWAIISLLREVPALLLRASTSELVGVVAYTLTFTLLESLLILGLVIIAGVALPPSVFKNKFAVIAAGFVLFTSVWSLPFHFGNYILLAISQFVQYKAFFFLIILLLSLWGTMYVIVIWKLPNWLDSNEDLERKVLSFIDRLVVLSSIYVVLDVLSIIVVGIRNIS